MRQLSYVDVATLKHASDWVSEVGARFTSHQKKTIFVELTSQLHGTQCALVARMHKIALPSLVAGRRGTLPNFPAINYRWQNADGACCGGLELSGNCTKRKFLALLRHMQREGFAPGTTDLMIFFHEPSAVEA